MILSGLSILAFRFDGVDDFVQVPDSISLNPYAAAHAECLGRGAACNSPRILWISPGKTLNMPDVNRSYLLNVVKDGDHGHFRAHLTTANTTSNTSWKHASFGVGHWYHVAMTYDGAALRLFVDGNEDASRHQ